MNKNPIIGIWDVETSFSIVTTFALKVDYISHENILQDWNILSASWKILDEDKIYNVHVGKDVQDDLKIVTKLKEFLESCDIIVAHNGDKFDMKKLNTRILFHGLPPMPKKIVSVDTLKEAKKHFAFTSNRLDYLGMFLGVGGKCQTSPGLWHRVLNGDQKAVKEMAEYNNYDVHPLLEGVYKKLRPYITHPNMGIYYEDDRPRCVNCGSDHMIKHSIKGTKDGSKYQMYQCKNCFACSSERTLIKKTLLK